MGPNAGYAVLTVIPSVRGIGRELTRQVSAPVAAAGVDAGRRAGTGIVSGIAGGLKAVAGTAGRVIGGGLAVVSGVAGTVAGMALSGGFSRALNIQDAQKKLEGLGHSTETVKTIMDNALASVRGTAFGMDAAAGLAATVVAAGVKPGQELERTLKLTADSATIAGVSLGEMGSIFGKVASSGKVTTDVLNQLSDRGVPALQFLGKSLGIPAEEAAKMVTEGKVSFAEFQDAMEQGLGGAALSSGETARGAFKNIGAALSRLGAMFVGPSVTAAPGLFQSIAGAVDRGSAALAPYADAFGKRLVPALASVQTWVDRIDFAKVIGGVQGLYDLVVRGDFTGAFAQAFHLEEDSTTVGVILGIRDGITGLYSLIIGGDFTGAFARAFHVEEDSGIVTFILGIRDAVTGFFSTLGAGDFSGAFSSIGTSLTTLQPAFQAFGEQLPKIGPAIAQLASSGITVLVNVLGFLADHVDTIIALMPLIVAGFVLWRGATLLLAAQSEALAAAQLAALPVNVANNLLRLQIARTELQVAAATGVSTAATNGGILSTLRLSAASIAQSVAGLAARGAALAGAAAMGVATAAQWLWNAAMSANPIGIVIIAIVALVAAIVWVATQTTFFQDLWRNAVKVIGTAASWLYNNAVKPAMDGIGAAFRWVYNSVIAPVVAGIRTAINAAGMVVRFLWTQYVQPALVAVGRQFQTARATVAAVMSAIGGAIGAAGNAIRGAFSGIGSFIGGAFSNVTGVIRGAINGIIGLANGAIRALNNVSVAVPAWVPGIGGQSFGIHIPTIPRLAAGADVLASPGGTLAILGEGGRDETVTDLGNTNAMIRAARRLAEQALAASSSDESVNFNAPVTVADVDEFVSTLERRKRRARAFRGYRAGRTA